MAYDWHDRDRKRPQPRDPGDPPATKYRQIPPHGNHTDLDFVLSNSPARSSVLPRSNGALSPDSFTYYPGSGTHLDDSFKDLIDDSSTEFDYLWLDDTMVEAPVTPYRPRRQERRLNGYPCRVEGCSWKFDLASMEKKHYGRVHAERQHRCDVCDKAFPSPKDVRRHAPTHKSPADDSREKVDQTQSHSSVGGVQLSKRGRPPSSNEGSPAPSKPRLSPERSLLGNRNVPIDTEGDDPRTPLKLEAVEGNLSMKATPELKSLGHAYTKFKSSHHHRSSTGSLSASRLVLGAVDGSIILLTSRDFLYEFSRDFSQHGRYKLRSLVVQEPREKLVMEVQQMQKAVGSEGVITIATMTSESFDVVEVHQNACFRKLSELIVGSRG